jgi:hypothetical protein
MARQRCRRPCNAAATTYDHGVNTIRDNVLRPTGRRRFVGRPTDAG